MFSSYIEAHKKYTNGPQGHEHVACAEKARDIFAELRHAQWHQGSHEMRRQAGKKRLRHIAKRAAAQLVYGTNQKPVVTVAPKERKKKVTSKK